MVRYWCGECNSEHDNARDCPHYSRVGRSYEKGQKVGNNMKKRRNMKGNDYSDPKNTPSSIFDDCFTVFILVIVLPIVSLIAGIWKVIEWIA